MNEQQVFSELQSDDQFDDSIFDQHQSDLRSEVLQAFDQPDHGTVLAKPQVGSIERRQRTRRSLGYAAIVAVCLIGPIAWFYHGNSSLNRPVVERPSVPSTTADSQLLASLVEVNAFRDEVSREALFVAIAMCEQEHDGRTFVDSVPP